MSKYIIKVCYRLRETGSLGWKFLYGYSVSDGTTVCSVSNYIDDAMLIDSYHVARKIANRILTRILNDRTIRVEKIKIIEQPNRFA